ncbi:hypothetical protein LJC35_07255 [Parabacteroides sp. OttesenSCG-928-N08]|nr:hypothetical protein [Parabacteroides sp. OttesenSCG-928-N08]
MKRLGMMLLLIMGAVSLVAFTSCNKDEDGEVMITVDGEASVLLEMNVAGDAHTVTVRGVEAWTAEATEWITIDKRSGDADRDVVVSVSVGKNEGEERLGSVVFTLPGGEFAMVSVVQPKGGSNK